MKVVRQIDKLSEVPRKMYISPFTSVTGRVKNFIEDVKKGVAPDKMVFPSSCTVYKYDNYLQDLLEFSSGALRKGAGVKIQLEGFQKRNPLKNAPNWYFMFDENHIDFPKLKNLPESLQKHYLTENRYADLLLSDRNDYVFINVADSMQESNYTEISIEKSWLWFMHILEQGYIPIVNLSNLRPAGTKSSNRLVATGALGMGDPLDKEAGSFVSMYERLYQHIKRGDITTLLQLLGQLNRTLRQGRDGKTGIICTAIRYDHPDFETYLKAPLSVLVGSQKRGVRIDRGVLESPVLDLIIERVNSESLFLEKIEPVAEGEEELFSNVCVTADTWIATSKGAKQVKDLLKEEYFALVDGQEYKATAFWSNGVKPILEVTTKEGYSVKLTANHKVLTTKGWVEAGNLQIGDKLQLNTRNEVFKWDGTLTKNQGWLLGYWLGNGTKNKDQNTYILGFWGEYKLGLMHRANECLSKPFNIPVDIESRDKFLFSCPDLRNLAQLLVEEDKTLKSVIEFSTSYDFCRGFLGGWFDADSHVQVGNKGGGGKCIQLTHINLENLKVAQRMLLRMGIKSRIYINHTNGGENLLPDGKGGHAYYKTQFAHRLDISGQANLKLFSENIGFAKEDKRNALNQLLASYTKGVYTERYIATVSSLKSVGEQEVFDCNVDTVHRFDANGIIVHNCVEILLPHRGTCLLSHVNAGALETPEQIPTAMVDTTKFLCELWACWRDKVPAKDAELFRPLHEDKQIGVGWLGWANFLAYMGVTYQQHAIALKKVLDAVELEKVPVTREALIEKFAVHGMSKAEKIAIYLVIGYMQSSNFAKRFGLERAFTMAPTQSAAFEYTDQEGFVCSRAIDPPFSRRIRRDSNVKDQQWVFHGRKIETASEVGAEVHQLQWDQWQRLMNLTGMAHTMSYDLWQQIDKDWLKWFIEESNLKTTYYNFHSKIDQSYLNKGRASSAIATTCDITEGMACGCAE